MIESNTTECKKSLFFLLFKLQWIGIHYPILGWSVTVFFTFAANKFNSHSLHFSLSLLSSFSVHNLFSHLSLLLLYFLVYLLTYFLTYFSPSLLIIDWLILKLPVLGSFSRDAAFLGFVVLLDKYGYSQGQHGLGLWIRRTQWGTGQQRYTQDPGLPYQLPC